MAGAGLRPCLSRTPDANWRGSFAAAALLVGGATLPGVGLDDGRRPVDASLMPWAALARINIPDVARCTGFLIDPHTAVTAAHCLYSARLGGIVPASAVHVLVGYDRGAYAFHGVAASVTVPPGFRTGGDAPDVAVIHLAAPAAAASHTLELAGEPVQAGSAAMLGGYSRERGEVLLADTSCTALGYAQTTQGWVLLHDCAGTYGSSGSPLLVRGPGGAWRVAGVQSRARAGGGGTAAPAAGILGSR